MTDGGKRQPVFCNSMSLLLFVGDNPPKTLCSLWADPGKMEP